MATVHLKTKIKKNKKITRSNKNREINDIKSRIYIINP